MEIGSIPLRRQPMRSAKLSPDFLLPEFRARALRVAAKIVGTDNAEDVVQNAYLSVLATKHPFRGECAPFTWFCRAVMNHSLMHLRRQKAKMEDPGDMPDLAASEMPIDVHIYRREQVKLICKAIGALRPSIRADMMARYFYYPDLTDRQIARIHGRSFSAMKSRLWRGRKTVAGNIRLAVN